MTPGQRERCRVVIECRRSPGGGRMATFTILTEVIRDVIRIGGRQEIRLMARGTGSGGADVTRRVAGYARRSSMGAGQRKSGGSSMVKSHTAAKGVHIVAAGSQAIMRIVLRQVMVGAVILRGVTGIAIG